MRAKQQLDHAWPEKIVVESPNVRFIVITPGYSGWDVISGDGDLRTLKSVERRLMDLKMLTRIPTESEREAAVRGALFGWANLRPRGAK